MPSKVAALVRNFLGAESDALCLVPGEKLFLMKGVSKVVVGREAHVRADRIGTVEARGNGQHAVHRSLWFIRP